MILGLLAWTSNTWDVVQTCGGEDVSGKREHTKARGTPFDPYAFVYRPLNVIPPAQHALRNELPPLSLQVVGFVCHPPTRNSRQVLSPTFFLTHLELDLNTHTDGQAPSKTRV